jgi:hypothetical protein
MGFFRLIDRKSVEMASVLSLKVVKIETHQSKTLLFSKGKLAVSNNSYKNLGDYIYSLHFTIRSAEGVRRAKFTKLSTSGFGLCLRPKA